MFGPARFRWYLKKGARLGMAYGSWLSGAAWVSKASSETSRIRLLTYHSFLGNPRDPFSVSAEDFEKQMAFLAKQELAVALDDLASLIKSKSYFKSERILVTIDDGLKSLYSHALPILRNYAIPAIAFVTPSELGIGCKSAVLPKNGTTEPRVTPQELSKLADVGVIIGSHSWTHRSMAQLTPEEAHYEATYSREILERHLGRPVTAFAYPFGTYADYNSITKQILKQSGYHYAFTSQHGVVVPGMDALELPRVKIEGGEGFQMFRLIVAGGLDRWRLIDQALWKFQSSGYTYQ